MAAMNTNEAGFMSIMMINNYDPRINLGCADRNHRTPLFFAFKVDT